MEIWGLERKYINKQSIITIPSVEKSLGIFGMSAVQRASPSRSASSGGDNGLCESDLPSTTSGAPCDDLVDAKEMISRFLEAARAQHADELRAERSVMKMGIGASNGHYWTRNFIKKHHKSSNPH